MLKIQIEHYTDTESESIQQTTRLTTCN